MTSFDLNLQKSIYNYNQIVLTKNLHKHLKISSATFSYLTGMIFVVYTVHILILQGGAVHLSCV